ncbi:MAG: response regulator [Planctomycetia bacterium]|nr:response regulator [Planctomycetia bacterium]
MATPPSILVVDDNDVVRSLLRVVLQQEGFVVWTAAGGLEAIDLFRSRNLSIDLVLLDVQMPGMDGLQTLAALRLLDPQVHCCLMSSLLRDQVSEDCGEWDGILFLPKPFDLKSLGQTLRRRLDGARKKPW